MKPPYRTIGLALLLTVAVCLTGCAEFLHRNQAYDVEFNTNGTRMAFLNLGRSSLFTIEKGMTRRTDERAISGGAGAGSDRVISGLSAETRGVKGNSRTYGLKDYSSTVRADAITAFMQPLSDVTKAYFATLGGVAQLIMQDPELDKGQKAKALLATLPDDAPDEVRSDLTGLAEPETQ